MNDRVYPSAKQAPPNGGVENGAANPTFPANKAQLYNASRPAYRPQPPPRRGHGRGCCCSCCLWTTIAILCVVLLAAIAGVVFYVIYRPHRPSFAVNSLRLSTFNLTDTAITSNFNISVTARNPNKRIAFFYEPITVRILSGNVDIGDGSFPAFSHGKKNVTTLRAVVSRPNAPIPDGTDLSALKSSFKSRNLPLKIQLETKVQAKVGKIKTKKLKIRVICDGIKIPVPAGRAAAATAAATTDVKCKVDPRVKIIKWTV